MNLMISVNDKYCEPAKVMLVSFLENNKFEHNDIYFLYGNVKPENVQGLAKLVEKNYDASFFPIHMDEDRIKAFPISNHISIETYYRFFGQEVLPASVERVLWLDADMIIRSSLKEFYYQDFEGKHLVVCQSINENPKQLIDKLCLPEDTIYFNAGTILFHLALMRETVKVSDYFDYIEKNRERITWHDQDVLNAMYHDKKKVDDYKKYNRQMFATTEFSKSELEDIEKNTCIVHYIGAVKPWDFRYQHVCGKYFLQYADKVWSGSQKFEYKCKHFLYRIKKSILR